jgi:hypothetical protein
VKGNFDAGVTGLVDFIDRGQEIEIGQAEGAVTELNLAHRVSIRLSKKAQIKLPFY